jgi:transcription elongation factor Elf1
MSIFSALKRRHMRVSDEIITVTHPKLRNCDFCGNNAPAVLSVTLTRTEGDGELEFWFCGHSCQRRFWNALKKIPVFRKALVQRKKMNY